MRLWPHGGVAPGVDKTNETRGHTDNVARLTVAVTTTTAITGTTGVMKARERAILTGTIITAAATGTAKWMSEV